MTEEEVELVEKLLAAAGTFFRVDESLLDAGDRSVRLWSGLRFF